MACTELPATTSQQSASFSLRAHLRIPVQFKKILSYNGSLTGELHSTCGTEVAILLYVLLLGTSFRPTRDHRQSDQGCLQPIA
eukprot:6200686-Pleurochrysis_carterae.AAC.2